MSYASIDDSKRTFTDDSGRSWSAERIGRTSGIVATGKITNLPSPSDIIRFTCQSDADEPDRETTVKAGALEEMEESELRKLHSTARRLLR